MLVLTAWSLPMILRPKKVFSRVRVKIQRCCIKSGARLSSHLVFPNSWSYGPWNCPPSILFWFSSFISSSRYSFYLFNTVFSLLISIATSLITLIFCTSFPAWYKSFTPQHHIQLNISLFLCLCYLSVSHTPKLPVLLSTFFISLANRLFLCFFLFLQILSFVWSYHTKSACLCSFFQRIHQIPCFPQHFRGTFPVIW